MRPEELTQLVERYEGGTKIQDLANEFGIDRRTVSHHLRARRVALRPYLLTAEHLNQMVRLYESGLSLADVGKQVGCSPYVVQRQLRDLGITVRSKTRRKK